MFEPSIDDTAMSAAGIVHIPEALHRAVGILGGKLTKGVYYKQTGNILPEDGGVMFQWFTNAQLREHGKIAILDALAGMTAMSTPQERSGKDLKDQFDYLYSVDGSGDLHVMQVVIGKMFGFVTIFSQTPGRLEKIDNYLNAKLGTEKGPFRFLSSNRSPIT